MVGRHPQPREACPSRAFERAGDRIVLLGEDRSEFGGAAYLRLLHGIEQGRPPAVDLDAELRLAKLLRSLVLQGSPHRARPLRGRPADGPHRGLLRPQAPGRPGRGAARGADLFSETQARALVACPSAPLERVLRAAEEAGVPAREIGEVGGADLEVRTGRRDVARLPSPSLHEIWSTALPKALGL